MDKVGIVYGVEQKIDAKDKKILKVLFEDGRMSIADIANKTRLRRDSVARRLKRLRKDKIITGFVPVINPPALGYPNIAMILLRIKSGNDASKKKFQDKLVENKFIVHVSKLIGKFDFNCVVIYENTNHLNQIVENIKTYVPNFIENFELFQIVDEPKFEKMSDLL
jgi:Lrp/AsnC family transcriptional regulator, leucine-responsive regulatory protein